MEILYSWFIVLKIRKYKSATAPPVNYVLLSKAKECFNTELIQQILESLLEYNTSVYI